VLPTIFGQMAGGFVFAVAFYVLLTIAALTSTVSLLEVVVSYFVDQRDWKRGRATLIVTIGCFLLAIPSAMSGAFLDVQNIIFGNFALSIGAFLICLFVGWRWGIPKALEEIGQGGQALPMAPVWSVLVRFVCPLGVLAILAYIIVTGNYH
jgi:NSS family neurotransmitter:Na+ symporter